MLDVFGGALSVWDPKTSLTSPLVPSHFFHIDYNQHVRLQTLKVAINNQIRWRSRSAFESVILKHFTLKAPEIAAQVALWCDHASASKREAMKAVAADLTHLLAALPKVQGSLKRSVEMVVLDSSRDTAPPKRAKAAQSVIDLT